MDSHKTLIKVRSKVVRVRYLGVGFLASPLPVVIRGRGVSDRHQTKSPSLSFNGPRITVRIRIRIRFRIRDQEPESLLRWTVRVRGRVQLLVRVRVRGAESCQDSRRMAPSRFISVGLPLGLGSECRVWDGDVTEVRVVGCVGLRAVM